MFLSNNFFTDQRNNDDFFHNSDTEPHLRLRFHGEKNKILTYFISALHDWSATLIQNDEIKDMNFSIYEREIERYGGEQLIDLAEAFFYGDSLTSLALIHFMLENKVSLPDYGIAALSLIDLLKNFGLNFAQQIEFFEKLGLEEYDLKGFREQKSALVSMAKKLWQNPFEDGQEGILFTQALQKRALAQKSYVEKIDELKEKKELTNSLSAIQDSCIHMHCNRLMGYDLKKERQARLYALHLLRTIPFILKPSQQIN